jgi:hypothetical protein
LWTADHDIDDPNETQITVYTGRGLYCDSTLGNIWLVGTAVEHHAFYQYQFAGTTNIYAGQIQTETAYWQPNPSAGAVFPIITGFNDPNFSASCQGISGNCADGWGLRIVSSSNILIYGAGLYSFFDNYSTACSNPVTPPGGNGATCQTRIFSIEEGIILMHIRTLLLAVDRLWILLESYVWEREHWVAFLEHLWLLDFAVHIAACNIIFSTPVVGIEMVGFWFRGNRKTT